MFMTIHPGACYFYNPLMTITQSTPVSMTAPTSSRLVRGTACLSCKQRKMRCSGERPSCAKCVRHDRECGYPVESAKSPTGILEDKLRSLEQKVKRLEANPSAASRQQPHGEDPMALSYTSSLTVPPTRLPSYRLPYELATFTNHSESEPYLSTVSRSAIAESLRKWDRAEVVPLDLSEAL